MPWLLSAKPINSLATTSALYLTNRQRTKQETYIFVPAAPAAKLKGLATSHHALPYFSNPLSFSPEDHGGFKVACPDYGPDTCVASLTKPQS